jgi:tetratricopeptide (TPR) repeat protein
MQPAKLLGLVLTHHERDPDDPVAWLNLGFAYRRMAVHRASDRRDINNRRIQLALSSFDRSLDLERHNAKAWIGRGLVFLQQKADFDQGAQCFRNALDIDPTAPLVWLFYSTALESAGRTDAALAAVDSAVEYYQRLDKEAASKLPEEFRSVLDEYQALRVSRVKHHEP